VFRGIHEVEKPEAVLYNAWRASCCFSLFFPELSAREVSYAAETLGRGCFDERNNSKTPAAPPLFFAVFARKNSERRENSTTAADNPRCLRRV
jgi:hypothetical protein